MKHFDEITLRVRLEALSSWRCVGFMLLCCDRMLPNYERFSSEEGVGDVLVLREGLRVAWSWLATSQLVEGLAQLRDECKRQAPNTEDFHSVFTSSALDAANAIEILLEALEMPSQAASLAVEVAALACDTVDLYIQAHRNLDPASKSFETEILEDPLMQAELHRQEDDLELISLLSDERLSAAYNLQYLAQQRGSGILNY